MTSQNVGSARLAAAVALSIALHAGALSFAGGAAGMGASAPSIALTARLVAPVTTRATQAVQPAPADVDASDSPQPSQRTTIASAQPRAADAASAPGPGPLGIIPGIRYYLASELDRRAKPLTRIEPDYPAGAGEQPGYLVLRVLINERGTVDDVIVLTAEPENVFEAAARSAFAQALFAPGMARGTPVPSQMLVEVKFDPGEVPADAGPLAGAMP